VIHLLLFLLVSGPAVEDTTDQWVHTRETIDHALAKGEALVVANPFGSIRIRGWEGREVNIIANIQKRKVNPAEARIEATREDGKLMLEAVFPSEQKTAWAKKPRRIDLTLLVPEKAELTVRAGDDLVEIKGFKGNVDVENGLGDVWIKTYGAVTIKSRQGTVTVLMMSRQPKQESRIETVHGTATIYFQEKARADVRVETAGKLTTDYSAEVTTDDAKRKKKATIRVGKGGQAMTIVSNQGDIEILRRY